MYDIDKNFSPESLHAQTYPPELLGYALFEFNGEKGQRLICHWKDHAALHSPRRSLENDLSLPVAQLPVRPGGKPGDLTSKWKELLSLATMVGIITAIATLLGVWDFLYSHWEKLVWHAPVDVSVRALSPRSDVPPGGSVEVKLAVENYTDWLKPYVRLHAVLTEDKSGSQLPVSVNPPDLPAVEQSGRAYVDVSSPALAAGSYTLELISLPLYEIPSAEQRQEDWNSFVAHVPHQGAISRAKVAIAVHPSEEIIDRTISQLPDDKTRCILGLTLVAWQPFPAGVQVSGFTPPDSDTWIVQVHPTRDNKFDAGSDDAAAIKNGAYAVWKTQSMQALERKTFEIYLQSRKARSAAEWEDLAKSMSFTTETASDEHKP